MLIRIASVIIEGGREGEGEGEEGKRTGRGERKDKMMLEENLRIWPGPGLAA